MLIRQPPAGIKEVLAEKPHHQIDRAARGPADEAAIGILAHLERQRGMVIIMKRAKAFTQNSIRYALKSVT